MTTVSRGQIYWLYPEDENALAKLGLVVEADVNESLFMMCHADIHLAGHLDPIFAPDDIGLPFAIAVFTHVEQWVQHSRISPAPIGTIPESICVDIELAGTGQQTNRLKFGFPLADPVMEPRWPLIEQIVTEFIADLTAVSTTGLGVIDEQSFNEALERVLIKWDQSDLSNEEKNRIQLDVMELGELFSENPDWCDEYTFYKASEIILGTSALALAA
jgi:hypothetical protein